MFGRWIAACASRRSFRYLLHPLAHRSSRIGPIGQEEQSLPLTWFRLPLDLKTPWSPMSFTFFRCFGPHILPCFIPTHYVRSPCPLFSRVSSWVPSPWSPCEHCPRDRTWRLVGSGIW